MTPNISKENFRLFMENPQSVLGVINEFGIWINKRFYKYNKQRRCKILEEDWDNFILLDGCRLDTFRGMYTGPGSVEQKISVGSDSYEFIQKNFVGKTIHDTIYITANPFVNIIPDGTFFKIVNLLESGWDENKGTVLPETVAKAALDTQKEYPNKRLIIHFMQPHYPFLGEVGEKINQAGITEWQSAKQMDDSSNDQQDIWTQLQYRLSDIDDETVIKAYKKNLDLVWDESQVLMNELVGKTIVSSDHGNLIGERLFPIPVRGYGHPRGVYVPELTHVPWLEIESTNRKSIIPDDPIKSENIASSMVEDRLESLGYR